VHDGTDRHDRTDRAPGGDDPPAVPRPREEARTAEPVRPPTEEDPLPALADLSAPGSLDDYADLLAALTAYDITGVRPAELDRYLAEGHVPDGIGEETLRRARRIAEDERERLLRLARP
jgi:hypothetical protein